MRIVKTNWRKHVHEKAYDDEEKIIENIQDDQAVLHMFRDVMRTEPETYEFMKDKTLTWSLRLTRKQFQDLGMTGRVSIRKKFLVNSNPGGRVIIVTNHV